MPQSESAVVIARRDLFGKNERRNCRISPDGKWLSWLAPSQGVSNIWIALLERPLLAQCITKASSRDISEFMWSAHSTHLLYPLDRDGDENWRVWLQAIEGGEPLALSPAGDVQARVLATSRDRPEFVAMQHNSRDRAWHDVFIVNLTTGASDLAFRNDCRIGSFVLDRQLRVRLALRRKAHDASLDLLAVSEGGELSPLINIAFSDQSTTAPLGFSRDGRSLFMLSSLGSDRAVLVRRDSASGEETTLAAHPNADVVGVVWHPDTYEPQLAVADFQRREHIPITAAAGEALSLMRERFGENLAVCSCSDDNRFWVAAHDTGQVPRFALLDRREMQTTRLFTSRPDLDGRSVPVKSPIVIRARDGLDMVSYLTLPPGSGARPDAGSLPLILLVHGGPWWRDTHEFDPRHAWLASRGYAVLSVNFRGSTGFGKAFLAAGDRQWGAAMLDDLLDAKEWAVRKGVANRDRVGIMGESYGGYAVLSALAFAPDAFRCGVALCAPANLETLLATTPPYWAHIFESLARRIGDPRTADGRNLLRARSPVNFAGRMTTPLLIAQGANDVRVKRAESDQIVGAIKSEGGSPVYLLYDDEGHVLTRKENALSFYALAENFLARHLGGSAEPVGRDLDGARLSIVEGREIVDTLGS